MRQHRAALEPTQKVQYDRAICAHIFAHLPLETGEVVAGYSAAKTEPDLTLLLQALQEERCTVCLPVIEESKSLLQFGRWSRGDRLRLHPVYGVEEPMPGVELLTPSVLLVPLLAFDAKGGRLGQGGGFYDRTLAALQQSDAPFFTLGVGYSFQQVSHVPCAAHDQKLDGFVTEKGVMLCV